MTAKAPIYPMLRGRCVIRGATLQQYLGDKAVTVRASSRFLSAIALWCDGRTALPDLALAADKKWGATQFMAFVQELLDAGVLLDANYSLADAFDAAQLPTRLGGVLPRAAGSAPPSVAPSPHERDDHVFARSPRPALSTLLRSGLPPPGFGADYLTCPQLLAILSAIGELTSADPCALASERDPEFEGRFQVLQVTLVLLRPMEPLGAGVYAVAYDGAASLRLQPLPSASSELYRAVAHPDTLGNAMWGIVLSADLALGTPRYANRALQLALLQAGAAFETARMLASALPIDCRVITGYFSQRLLRLCDHTDHKLMGLLAFGASGISPRPDPAPQAIEINWFDTDQQTGVHTARAHFVDEHLSGLVAWGRSSDARHACEVALSEAAERYAYRQLGSVICSTALRLDAFIDPATLVTYLPDQISPAGHARPIFRREDERLWTAATQWGSGQQCWVPVEFVYALNCLPLDYQGQALTAVSSSGCASDTVLEVAIERAAFEVIERDAFARHWLTQTGGQAIANASLPAEILEQLRQLELQSCSCSIQSLALGLGPVMLVVIQSQALGFSVVGTASGPAAHDALTHAMSEASVAAHARLSGARPKRAPGVRAVRSPKDHSDLYAHRRYFQRVNALLGPAETAVDFLTLLNSWPATLRERLRGGNAPHQLFWCDVTAKDGPRALDGRKIATVRALIPGRIPIAFGYDALPAGMTDTTVARGRFPHPMA